MKEILNDRRMAFAITIFVIIASVLTGAERSLNKIRMPIEQTFYKGIFVEGESIENDLKTRTEYTANLITIAERYVQNDSTLEFLKISRDELLQASYLYEKYTANQKLTEASNLLYDRLIKEELTERDLKYVEAIYANLKSSNNTIFYEAMAYNDQARKFNELLNNFPGNLIKSLSMIAPLEVFEGGY